MFCNFSFIDFFENILFIVCPINITSFFDKSFRGKFINLIQNPAFSQLFSQYCYFFNFLNTGCLVYDCFYRFDSLLVFSEKLFLKLIGGTRFVKSWRNTRFFQNREYFK